MTDMEPWRENPAFGMLKPGTNTWLGAGGCMALIMSPVDPALQLEMVIKRGATTEDAKNAADFRKVRLSRMPPWIANAVKDMVGLRMNTSTKAETWRFVIKCGCAHLRKSKKLKRLRERNQIRDAKVTNMNEIIAANQSKRYEFKLRDSFVESREWFFCFDKHRDMLDTLSDQMKLSLDDVVSIATILAISTATPKYTNGIVTDAYHAMAVEEATHFWNWVDQELLAP